MNEESFSTAANSGATTDIASVHDAGKSILQQTRGMFHIDELSKLFTWEFGIKIGTHVLIIIVFYIIYRLVKGLIRKNAAKKLRPVIVASISKAVSYTFYVLIIMYILDLFNVKLSAIWGAAGIAGVALGFAAQTSVSNVISGLFLLTEKTMKIGDFIEIDGVSGTVDLIGFLSVRVHTLDNQFVRIPNSTIIDSQLKNYSTFDLRRFVFELSVDYDSDLDKTLEVLSTVPAMCPTVLLDREGYEPRVMYTALGASGIIVNIAVWFERANLIQTRTDLCRNVVKVCRAANIVIPFNHVDVTILDKVPAQKAAALAAT